MLIPVYLCGSSYYLHTRIGGKQIKRTLRTHNKSIAMIRASKMLEALMNEDDHRRLLETLEALKGAKGLEA